MLAEFFLWKTAFWIFEWWQIFAFLVVIALIIFMIQYRKRQM